MRQHKWIKRWYALAMSAALTAGVGCGDGCGSNNGTSQAECTTNADCSSNEVCNAQQVCVVRGDGQDCERDTECLFNEYCAAGTCASSACGEDDDCATGSICDDTICRAGCREDDQCSEGQVCNTFSNKCEAAGCLSTGCAPNLETCDESGDVPRCVPTGNCTDDGNCAVFANYKDDGDDYICDTNQQKCVVKPPCVSDGDCPIGDICEERGEGMRNRCRPGCREDGECATGEFCDVEGEYTPAGAQFDKFVCIRGCTSPMDCNVLLSDPNGDYACVDLLCIPKCEGIDDCAEGLICTGQPSTCQGCTSDNQCPSTQFCDKTLGQNDAEAADENIGLCADLPPDCTPDGYGENTGLDSAYRVESFPFVADGTVMDVQQPYYCQENNNDGEWFVVNAEPGKIITITVNYEAMGANLDLALKSSVGADLLTSARPPTVDQGQESLVYGVEVGGDYYIHVRGGVAQKALPYMLTIDVADPPACVDDMFEENDLAASPAVLTADTDYTMLQVCGTDRDFYQIDVLSNQVVTIETIGAVRDGDLDIFVTTPAGDAVASAATTNDNETLYFATEAPGTYIVEIAVASGVGNIDYDLRWSQRPNACSDSYDAGDANNSCDFASPLTLTPVAGTDPGVSVFSSADSGEELRICNDEDWYKVTLLPLQQVKVTATYNARQSAGFIDVRLRGPGDCSVIAAFDERNRDANDPNIVTQDLSYTAANGGEFYVVVSRAQGINVIYDLDIEVTDGPFCPEDEFDSNGDSNDDIASAVVIDRTAALAGTENAYVGLRYCDLDEDFYSIDLEVGDTIRWVVSHRVGQGQDLDATIYLPDGSNPVTGTSTTDDEEVTYTATQAGTHTLRVYAKNPIRTDYRLLTYITPAGGTEVGPLDPDCPDDFENNDTSAEATDIGPGTYGLLVCGQTSNGVDDDWFRVHLEPGETLDVRLDFIHSSGNIDLLFYKDGVFNLPLLRSQTLNDVEELSYTAQVEQDIYVKVATYSTVPSNAYEMTVAIAPAPGCVDDASEQNDTAATAFDLDSPGFVDRQRKCEDDEDWYAIEVTENQQAEVYANFFGEADIDLYVYSDAGTTLVGEGISTNARSESVIFTAPDDGSTQVNDAQTVYTYYVKVETKVRARTTYDLLVYRDLNNNGTFGPGEGNPDRNCPDRYEDNDSRTTPAALAAGLYDDLRLCWRGGTNNDADYYTIFVPNGATLTVDLLFSHAQGNLQLAILRPNFTQATSSLSTDDNETATVTNTTGAGVTYIVHVYGAGSGYENYYDLDLQLSFGNACPEDALGEPTLADATSPLSVGQYTDLALCEGTEDWFAISASANDRILAEFELNNTFGNIDVQLTDDQGSVLASSTNDGNRETIDYTPSSTDTYYLRVFSRNDVFIRNFYDMWLSIDGVEPAEPFCPDGYERNDTLESAAPLSLATSTIYSDMIACGEDDDWYVLSGVSTGTYNVIAFFDQAAGSNIDVTVVDASGATVASGTSSTNDESLTFNASSSQTYYVHVKNVAATAAETPYTLYVNRQGAANCPEDSYEQNDTPAEASARPQITMPGKYVLGSCDEDYFFIVADQSGPLTLTVAHDEASLGLFVQATNTTSGMFQSANSATTNRKIVSFPSVTAGDVIQLYVGKVSGTGPYILEYAQ